MSGNPKRDDELLPFDEATNAGAEPTTNRSAAQEKAPEPLVFRLSIPPLDVKPAETSAHVPEPLRPMAENLTPTTFISDEPTQVPGVTTGELKLPVTTAAEPKWRTLLNQAKEQSRAVYDRFHLLNQEQRRWIYAGFGSVLALSTAILILPRHLPKKTASVPHRQHVTPPAEVAQPPAPVVHQAAPPPAPAPVVQAKKRKPIAQPAVVAKAKAPAKVAPKANKVSLKTVSAPKKVAKTQSPTSGKKPSAKTVAKNAKKGKVTASAKGKTTKDKRKKMTKVAANAKGKAKSKATKKKDAKTLAKKKGDKPKRSIASDKSDE